MQQNTSASRKKIELFIFYFLILGSVAAHRPYMILYYQSLSFTGAQIGLIVGLAPLITIFSLPFITGIADRLNRHRFIMSSLLIVLIATVIVFPYLESFILLFGLALLSAVIFSPIMPLANSSAMFMLGEQKEMFGRIRLGGTIGYSIVATVVGALVENTGLKIAFWSAAGLFFIAFLVSRGMVYSGEDVSKTPDTGRASELLRNPHFLLFLLIGFSGGISFATINTYLFPYMKELGAGESMMGIALTLGTVVEVPVLLFVNRFIKRYNSYPLLIFALLMTSLRFFLLAIANQPILVLFIQLLNGLNFPLLTVAAVTYADERAPAGFRATAQGLFNVATGGIGSAIGGFAGGLLFDSIGPKGMYLSFAIFLLVVLVFVNFVRRLLPPEKELVGMAKSI